MSDEEREITDDMLLGELTVGEFRQLMATILSAGTVDSAPPDADTPVPPIKIRRKSLDEFMSDLKAD